MLVLWNEAKLFLQRSSSISHDAWHVLIGTALFLLLALLLRRSVGSWRPWLALLVLALLNEIADLLVERWPSLGIQAGEGAKDIILTMAIPLLLLLTARAAPQLYQWKVRAESERPTEGKEGRAPKIAPGPDWD